MRQGPPVEPIPAHRVAWRARLYVVIFGHDTPAGRAFDVALIISIFLSVAAVMLDSVASIRAAYGPLLNAAEWIFTLLFTVEYVLRLLCAPRPAAYSRSFFGLVDLASILPTYLSLVLPGTQYLQVIRVLRVLRVFRVLKLAEYIGEAEVLLVAVRNSRRKLSIFIATVLVLAVIFGAAMYLVEGRTHGFTSIPQSIYWTIVTITTVGYGDIAPATSLGQSLASMIMLLGYAIVAVPTSIVTVELTRSRRQETKRCANCARWGTTETRCTASSAEPRSKRGQHASRALSLRQSLLARGSLRAQVERAHVHSQAAMYWRRYLACPPRGVGAAVRARAPTSGAGPLGHLPYRRGKNLSTRYGHFSSRSSPWHECQPLKSAT
ncbi:MAG: ion transporter [Gemmatimonadaceae bacterium]